MALKRTISGLLLCCLLCGCGAPAQQMEETGSGSAAAPAQQETDAADAEPVDPPIDESVTDATHADQPLAGMVICLDPGHGVTDARAQERVSPLSQETKAAYVSGASGASQTEEELNLAVAQLTQEKLEALGAQIVMTRTAHAAAVSNIERAQIANDAGAALCIRIHADGSEDASASGMSMQVPAGELLGTPEIVQPSEQAATYILSAVTETTGARSRGLTPRSDLTGFNWSEVPCVLLEMGFLSNAQEDARLATADYRQKIADGIAQGVCRWVQG